MFHIRDNYRGVFLSVTESFYTAVNLPSSVYDLAKNRLSSRQYILEENKRLTADNLLLKSNLSLQEDLKNENTVLRDLLSTSAKITADFTIAEVLAVANYSSKNIAIIARGRVDDVYPGQAVLDPYGVFGNVIEVGEHTSKVLLISDRNNAVPVQNSRGVRAILSGAGDGAKLELLDITKTSDFHQGDKLVTSGLAMRYIPGYPVGVIASISYDTSSDFARVLVEPYAKFNQSRQLLLVWPRQDKIIAEARQSYATITSK